jgi:hypothetical protein
MMDDKQYLIIVSGDTPKQRRWLAKTKLNKVKSGGRVCTLTCALSLGKLYD